MRISKVFYLAMATVLLVSLIPLTVAASPRAQAAAIEQELLDAFDADGTANFFVKMAVEADLSAAYDIADWSARGQYVYDALQEVAATTQAPVIEYARRNGLEYTSMLVTNSVFIRGGGRASAEGLAALPGVAYLRAERIVDLPDPVGAGVNGFASQADLPEATLAWGIADTNADDVWNTYGVRGTGIVVANIDTGVDSTHEALNPNYKCGDGDDSTCWLDPGTQDCTPPGGAPCDTIYAGIYHGTHTMGTMAAVDDPTLSYTVGMAPDAQWIACLGCPYGSCPDFDTGACAEWMIAPGGDSDARPHVVNNSWGGPGGDPWYLSYVNAWRAAGIFPAFSAGNEGSACGTLGSAGDYQESFGSAAHDSGRTIASTSSRGPSVYGHDPYTKPNLSAPGVSVLSAQPGDSWGYISGTSMASPHSAGAVALVWAGCPGLIGNMSATFEILQDWTDAAPAGNCGAPDDGEGNYTYGYGYLNALYSVASCIGGVEFGTLEGYVYDQDMNPVEGATVSAQPAGEANGIDAVTDPSGFYTMQLLPGTYDVTASRKNYTSQTVTGVVITAETTTPQDFTIEFLGSWTQISLPTGCPDWTRIDAEYYPGTSLAYILGGRGGADGNSTFGDIYAFDPVAQTCADTGANMPVPISNYTINLVSHEGSGWLCTFGGRSASGANIMDVQCYDPVANTATVVASLPAAYAGYTPGAQAVVDNKVYVFGGFSSTGSPYDLARTDRFDPETLSFSQIGNLTLARAYIDTAVVDGKIYAFGGTVFDGASLIAQTRTEVMADPGGAGTWDNAAVAELPTATAEGRAYGFDNGSGYELAGQIVIAGGGQWPEATFEALLYDVATDSYDYAFPDLNALRRNHAGFFVPGDPGKMWVFGGWSGADAPPYAPPEYYEVGSAGGENTMHVFGIEGYITQDYLGRPVLRIHVGVEDQDNNPLSEVLVTAWIWTPDAGPIERARLTKPSGYAFFHWGSTASGTWSLCVQDLERTGYVYNVDDNAVTCMEWYN